MLIVVYGGSGSGKSEFGEQILEKQKDKHKYYIATMRVFDAEGERKVRRHQKMREAKGFLTIESPTKIEEIQVHTVGNAAILECMSNLLANEMYDESGRKESPVECILEGIRTLQESFQNLIIITNNIFEDGQEYEEETRKYMEFLGSINRRMAAASDITLEIVHGIPCVLKGEEEFEKISK